MSFPDFGLGYGQFSLEKIMKTDRVKKIIRAICFLLISGIFFIEIWDVTEVKTSNAMYSEFWQEPSGYDVLFLGTSHMYYGVSPMKIWKDYGITSYNLAAPSSQLPQSYWTLKCALEYNKPKVVVIDTYLVHANKKREGSERIIHDGMDSIPVSATKAKAVMDLFDTQEEWQEYLFEFYIYHTRWKELGEEDFNWAPVKTKGAQYKSEIVDNSSCERIAEDVVLEKNTVGYTYLRKIIEECQKEGIQVVLTAIPNCNSIKAQKGMNGAGKIAEEYKVPFLNMPYEEALVDPLIDYADRGHLNQSGSNKITDYLGKYLSENCDLTDYRTSEAVAGKWEADYREYKAYRTSLLKEETELPCYLLWLNDKSYNCFVYQRDVMNPDTSLQLRRLFENVGNKQMIDADTAAQMLGAKPDAEYAFILQDMETGEVIDKALFLDGKKQ